MGRPRHKELWQQHTAYAVTKLTLDVIQKFDQAFSIGATIEEACDYADVSPSTYYNWAKKYPALLERFERMRQRLPLKAKQNIAQAIHNSDLSFSKWLVEYYSPPISRLQIEDKRSTSEEELPPEDKEAGEAYLKMLEENAKKRNLERAKQPKQQQ